MLNKKQNYILISFLALAFGISIALIIYKIPSVLDYLISYFQTDAIIASWFMSALTFISLVLAIPTSLFIKKFGAKTMAFVGAIFATVGSIIGAVSPFLPSSIWIFVFSRGLEGFSYIFVSVSMPILLSIVVNQNKIGFATGLWGSWASLGTIIGSSLTPVLVFNLGFCATWLLYGALVVCMTFILVFCIKAPFSAGSNTEKLIVKKSADSTEKNPASYFSICLYMISFALLAVLQITLVSYTPTCLQKIGGFNTEIAGLISTIPIYISIPVSLLFGYLCDKFGTFKFVFAFGVAVTGPGIFLIFNYSEPWYILGLILSGIGISSLAVTAVGVFEMFHPRLHSFAVALGMTVCCLGQFLGTSVMPLILGADFSGWANASYVALCIGVVATVMSFCMKTKRSK